MESVSVPEWRWWLLHAVCPSLQPADCRSCIDHVRPKRQRRHIRQEETSCDLAKQPLFWLFPMTFRPSPFLPCQFEMWIQNRREDMKRHHKGHTRFKCFQISAHPIWCSLLPDFLDLFRDNCCKCPWYIIHLHSTRWTCNGRLALSGVKFAEDQPKRVQHMKIM